MAVFRLTSPAFAHDEELPTRFHADDANVSPPLRWEHVPDGAKELVLICDDPDSEAGVVTHWVAYGILPGTDGLPEAVPDDAIVEDGELSLVQGLNEFDELGYTGPTPEEDRLAHRVFFRLFALDTELDLPPGITRADVRRAAKEHIIGTAELVCIL